MALIASLYASIWSEPINQGQQQEQQNENAIYSITENLYSFSKILTYKGIDYSENEAIILFKKGVDAYNVMYDILQNFTTQQFHLVNAMLVRSSTLSTEQIIKLFSQPQWKKYIISITPNFAYKPISTEDTYYNDLWAIENNGQNVNGTAGTYDADTDASDAWLLEMGNNNVVVAVLDTGIDYTHEDLKNNMWNGAYKHGYDFAGDDDGNNDDDPMPDYPYDKNGHYHGTHVAGIIAAEADNNKGVTGIAPHVSLMALKVFRPNGYGYSSDILEALDYVSQKIDEGVNIVAINASYGGGGGSQDDAMNAAIKKLGEKGVLFCAAAGNDGENIDQNPSYPASYDAANIIAVAASDQDDHLASFSNYGQQSVDIAAPGVNILSTYPENKYVYADGTSMATPYVTGSVALLSAYNPNLSAQERKDLLLQSVDPKDDFANTTSSGGRLNINNALNNTQSGGGDNNGGDNDNGGNGDDNGDNQEPTNNPPVAQDDSAQTNQDEAVTIDVLANDSDPDGDPISISSYTQPAHGYVEEVNGKLRYTPDSGYYGEDSFSYTISDGKDNSSANVTITVEKKEENNGGFFGGLFGGGGGWFW